MFVAVAIGALARIQDAGKFSLPPFHVDVTDELGEVFPGIFVHLH